MLLRLFCHMIYFKLVFRVCGCLGMVMSQTTLSPAVTITTVSANVTTATPSTTGPSCSALNTSTCTACAPGSYSNNGGFIFI